MPKSVLVADDSLTIRKVVGMLFAGEELQLIAVDNGLDAVAKTRELRPDLVLADCMMPGRNGYEVCQELKSDPSTAHIPVLLLSGTFEPFDAGRAQAVGANGHIQKPFDSTGFLDRVRMSVGLSASAAMPNPLAATSSGASAPAPVAMPQPMASQPRPPVQPLQGIQQPRPMPGAQGMMPPQGLPQRPMGVPMGTQPGMPPRAPMPMGAQPGMPPRAPMPMGTQPGMPPRPMGVPMGTQPGMPPRPMGVPGMPGTMPQPGMARPPMPGMPPAPGMPGGFPRPPGSAPLPGVGAPPRRDPFGLPPQQQQQQPQFQQPPQRVESLDLDSHRHADGGESVLRDALSKASKEVIEKIAWEVVPQLAEVIIKAELERLIKDREAKGLA